MPAYKILMADDDAEDLEIIKDAMELLDAGDIIAYLDNGEQVINLLNQIEPHSVLPSLIILDLNMPKMNGIQTLEFLKQNERFKDIPVIIFSTSINFLDQEKSLLLGASAYITKPVSFNESIETTKRFLSYCT
jgi:CheY-like chemotaxis protein